MPSVYFCHMKLSPFRTVLVASVALLISASPTARAADTDDLLFYAPVVGNFVLIHASTVTASGSFSDSEAAIST